jgi:hypothetical protein
MNSKVVFCSNGSEWVEKSFCALRKIFFSIRCHSPGRRWIRFPSCFWACLSSHLSSCFTRSGLPKCWRFHGCSLSPFGVESLFAGFGGNETVDVSPEFDDLAEQVRGFLLPVCHRLLSIGIAGCELFPSIRSYI